MILLAITWYIIGLISMMAVWYKFSPRNTIVEFRVLDAIIVITFAALGALLPLFLLFTYVDEFISSHLAHKYKILDKTLFKMHKKLKPKRRKPRK
jgi:polyferredoxin